MTFIPQMFWPYIDEMSLKDELLHLLDFISKERTGEDSERFGIEHSKGYSNCRNMILGVVKDRLLELYRKQDIQITIDQIIESNKT